MLQPVQAVHKLPSGHIPSSSLKALQTPHIRTQNCGSVRHIYIIHRCQIQLLEILYSFGLNLRTQAPKSQSDRLLWTASDVAYASCTI